MDIEQTVRATVGAGQIIVRDNPGQDLSGLNRDPAKAITTTTNHNINFTATKPFDTLDKYTDFAKEVVQKSQDVEDYGFNNVIQERIDRGKSELQKGIDKVRSSLK